MLFDMQGCTLFLLAPLQTLYDLQQPITPHDTLFGEISNSKLDFKSEWLKKIQLSPFSLAPLWILRL